MVRRTKSVEALDRELEALKEKVMRKEMKKTA